MKKPVRILILISAAFILLSFYANAGNPVTYELSQKSPQASDNQAGWTDREWRAFDVNADNKFDKKDIEQLLSGNYLDFKYDLNGDGTKDAIDILCLYLKLSVLDRNCNEAVSDDDFSPVSTVTLPAADEGAVQKLVDETVEETRKSLPADVEEKLFSSLPVSRPLTSDEKAYVFRMAGMSALIQKNLEAARWAYGRAYQTDNRSAISLGSLAFTFAVDKKHDDALDLLALALELFPKSGATFTTIAWIFARHDQKDEAIMYYQLAASNAPEIGQYNMNLGIEYMRSGKTMEAHDQFQAASEKDPEDVRATIYSYVTDPSFRSAGIPPEKFAGFKKAYQDYVKMNLESDPSGDYLPRSWEELSQCEQGRKIAEILENRYTDKLSQETKALTDHLTKTIHELIKEYMPRWKKASEDMRLFDEGCDVILETEAELKASLEREAGKIGAGLCQEHGRELLSYSQFFMESALKQAEADGKQRFDNTYRVIKNVPVSAKAVSDLKSEAYKDALEDAMAGCYSSKIDKAVRLLREESRPQHLSDYRSEITSYFAVPMAIISGCMSIPGYCEEEIETGSGISGGLTIGLDLWIIKFEWNTTTGEVELNVGQGLIVGATWSPEAGFGFQVGAGLDLGFGPAEIYGKGFIVFHSDGSVSVKAKFEASVELPGTGIELGDRVEAQAVVLEPWH